MHVFDVCVFTTRKAVTAENCVIASYAKHQKLKQWISLVSVCCKLGFSLILLLTVWCSLEKYRVHASGFYYDNYINGIWLKVNRYM